MKQLSCGRHQTGVAALSLSLALFGSTLPARNVPQGPSAQIMTQRLGTGPLLYQGSSLVQACIGVNPPGATNGYQINGTPCDVFPIAADSLGRTTAVHVVAPVTNPGGQPAIPGVPGSSPPVLQTSTQSPSTLQVIAMNELTGITLHVNPSNAARMTCKPLDRTFAGRIAAKVTLSGKYLRQTVTSSRFVLSGIPITNREATALIVYAVLTERSDFPAATLDLMIANAAYDPTHNVLPTPATSVPNGSHPSFQNPASDGPFFFRDMTLSLVSPALQAVLFAPRPGSFQEPVIPAPGVVELVSALPGTGEVQALLPGSYFVRRLCVYKPASFPSGFTATDARSIALDIVDRRDFGWAIGSLGYMVGGYTEAQFKAPDLRFLTYAGKSSWAAVDERGKRKEQEALSALLAPIPGQAFSQAGWFKGAGEMFDALPTGELDVQFSGYTWPSNGEMKARLIWGDRYMERSHLAAVNVKSGWPLTDTEYAKQGGGVFPTGFSAEDVPAYFVLPQHCVPRRNTLPGSYWQTPTASTALSNTVVPCLETATLDLPWNTPATSSGQTSPFLDFLNWCHPVSGYCGPYAWTHMSKLTSNWRANAYGLNDAISWLAIEFHAHAFSFAAGRFDAPECASNVANSVAGNRMPYTRQQGNLFAFNKFFRAATASRVGFWNFTSCGWTSGIAPGSPRAKINGLAALAIHYSHASNSERTRWTLNHNGLPSVNSENDIRFLLKQFYDHVTTDVGLMFSSDGDDGAPSAYQGLKTLLGIQPDILRRTGDIPHVGFNIPANTVPSDPTPRWAHALVYQQAYGAAALQGLELSMLRGTPHAGAFDRIARFADIWAESTTPFYNAAVGPIHFNSWHPTNRGGAGILNPMPTEASARLGELFWQGTLPNVANPISRPEHFMLMAAWQANSTGAFGKLPLGLKAVLGLTIDPLNPLETISVRTALRARFQAFTTSPTTSDEHLADHVVPLLGIL